MSKPKVDLSMIDTSAGEAQHRFAAQIAEEIDPAASPIIQHLTDIKAEYEGGPFLVLHNILKTMEDTTVERLPKPHSDTGNNPAIYKLKRRSGKNEKLVTIDFYNEGITDQLPSVIRALREKDQLSRSLADPNKVNQSDIPKEMLDLQIETRMARIKKLGTLVSTARRNVKAAFEFFFQKQAIDELKTVTMSLVMGIENGMECDGEDGRPYRVEETSTPIVLTTTMPNRTKVDTKMLSLTSFNKIDVEKAKESPGGATYHALLNTIAKGADGENTATGGVAINTVETFFNSANDISEYLHRCLESTSDNAAWQSIAKAVSGKDKSGEALKQANERFYNLKYIWNNLQSIVGDPVSDVRFEAYLNENGSLATKKHAPKKAA
jgi:hypothetical protein